MNIKILINQIYTTTDIMSQNIFDTVNDKFVIRKLTTIAQYLEHLLANEPSITYLHVISDYKFQRYVWNLEKPASLSGYYNPNLGDRDNAVVISIQDTFNRISEDITLDVNERYTGE